MSENTPCVVFSDVVPISNGYTTQWCFFIFISVYWQNFAIICCCTIL